jgi:Spy/CpxP family protein refolding chaperone
MTIVSSGRSDTAGSEAGTTTARPPFFTRQNAPKDKQAEVKFHQQIAAVLTPAQRAQVQAQFVKLHAAGCTRPSAEARGLGADRTGQAAWATRRGSR